VNTVLKQKAFINVIAWFFFIPA